jgi:hypothetical protein
LGLDTFVKFRLEPFVVLSQIFKSERELGYHLSKYRDVLELSLPDLAPLRHRAGGRLAEREWQILDAHLRPDLVFKSDKRGWVVFELERGDPKRESVMQLRQYMAATSELKRDPNVIGVLVTAPPRRVALRRDTERELQDLRTQGLDVRWIWYNVAVELEFPPAVSLVAGSSPTPFQ